MSDKDEQIWIQGLLQAYNRAFDLSGLAAEDHKVRQLTIEALSRVGLGLLEIRRNIFRPDFVRPRNGGGWFQEEVIARGQEEVKVKRDNKDQRSGDNFAELQRKIEDCRSIDELEEFQTAYAEQLFASPYQDELTAVYNTKEEVLSAV